MDKLTNDRLNKPTEHQQPSYLKSPSYPVIPTNRADAPFGYDDSGKPIKVPLPEAIKLAIHHEIIKGDTPNEFCQHQKLADVCPYCREEARQHSIAKDTDPIERPVQPTPLSPEEIQEREREVLLKSAKRFFFPGGDVIRPAPIAKELYRSGGDALAEAIKRQQVELNSRLKRIRPADLTDRVCLREVLGLTREEIAGWLDRVIATKRDYDDQCPRDLTDYTALISANGAEIEIQQKLLAGTTKKNMPMSDSKGREKERRTIKKEIRRLENEIREYLNARRRKPRPPKLTKEEESRLPYQERILRKRDFKFGDLFPLAERSAYREALNLKGPFTPELEELENRIIQSAIQVGYCPRPSAEIEQRYPWLLKQALGEFESSDEAVENRLIDKTGGAQIGGQIPSAGWRFSQKTGKFTRRQLTSFDSVMDQVRKTDPAFGSETEVAEAFENPEEFCPS